MLQIHEFWVELFPIFQNGYEFLYIYLDFATILIFIKLILTIPSMLLFRSRGDFKW